jgi:hypothetical protein
MQTTTIALPPGPIGPDKINGGTFQITGTTKVKGSPNAPVGVRVICAELTSCRAVMQAWSNPQTGEYVLKKIKPGVYYTLAFDHTGVYNGVVATGIVAEPMP